MKMNGGIEIGYYMYIYKYMEKWFSILKQFCVIKGKIFFYPEKLGLS